MTDIGLAFCRALLRALQPELEAAGVRVFKDAWVYRSGRTWEFHGPPLGWPVQACGTFYWYGRADNAYYARYRGWRAWLDARSERS